MLKKFGQLTRQHAINELTKLFKENESAIVTSFKQVDVNKMQAIKKPLKNSSARFKVVKNSMAKIAVKKADMEGMAGLFDGTCAVTFCDEDGFLAASKIFVNFSKENEGFKIRGGCLAGEFIDAERIRDFALLPGREALVAKAIGTMKSPITGLVGVLNNVINGFVRVVDQLAKKKGSPSSRDV
ncbi:MAG: 50S ribosomal protein L10 [Candidatus Omnitrophica bacterium CG12_big_fil_rev_8_21_14_0_65_43_15]|uniref:Large ribosomal subunit protein uL10 n=1 Tax=Candidatus Taenaricola geysiri TaxID=1974752 RepID=A0A2J0LJU9_9BACT|nr:MAG: 50S ribosomal protein L10 [Candidatus Omnitrophica bacterium CG1_02_43_210]PIR65754.1 MAG: 50S ribosomal protein L10 [Candidatus Omnitrophica bacterium CG10_big_fil_rev_8_21_14_0_10_43_8]PIV11779.1 MAG: 50S ribosomal protein L10 [Candidatus Omnitrophica bacterium CG03_land_8_20_14_0_80_43_22]PIW65873.1 MAG: 50S ribosomal protein L10 [Candidatus Omnitrophica bacterium CG12_big_fil_rev_8_21_14_0_65_43_15]PIW80184.1 MAG: 50S ribosomal protein L10 [Candidatus Omnitrophica bacterium CG_4_8_1